jgi:hypothetical protein
MAGQNQMESDVKAEMESDVKAETLRYRISLFTKAVQNGFNETIHVIH